jgi:hypothetical protein
MITVAAAYAPTLLLIAWMSGTTMLVFVLWIASTPPWMLLSWNCSPTFNRSSMRFSYPSMRPSVSLLTASKRSPTDWIDHTVKLPRRLVLTAADFDFGLGLDLRTADFFGMASSLQGPHDLNALSA